MQGLWFKILTSKPLAGDYIEVRLAGAADTAGVGQLKDLDGGNLANPFQVQDAGTVDGWGVAPPDPAQKYDIWWVEGNELLAKAQSFYNESNFDPLTTTLKGCEETEQAVIDATAGGVIDILFASGQIIPVDLGTADVTFTFSDLPVGGSMTLELAFTGVSNPNFIWPPSLTGDPDVSAATPQTGHALVEVLKTTRGLWLIQGKVV